MRHIRYSKQSGNGMFVGHRYQRGNGFFGKMIKNALFPLLKYIGKQGIKTAIAIGEEAARNPSDIKAIARSKLKEVGLKAIDDGASRIKQFVQTGKGVKRKAEVIKGSNVPSDAKKMKFNKKVRVKPRTKAVLPSAPAKKSRKKSKKTIKGRKRKRWRLQI